MCWLLRSTFICISFILELDGLAFVRSDRGRGPGISQPCRSSPLSPFVAEKEWRYSPYINILSSRCLRCLR